MGKAREQEVRLMGLGFIALTVLAAIVLVVGAVKIGSEMRSHSSGSQTPGLELLGSQPQ